MQSLYYLRSLRRPTWPLVTVVGATQKYLYGKQYFCADAAQQPTKEVDNEWAECWHCGKHLGKLQSFFCGGCKGVQPARLRSSYFEVMGMNVATFDVDQDQLEKRYKALQFLLHPDKFEVKSDTEKEYSLQQASLVNNAYTTLKNPLLRAKYLCKLKGWRTPDEEEGTIEDPQLLQSIMEAREAIEDTEDPQELQQLRNQNLQRQSKLCDSLSNAFQNQDKDTCTHLINELTYVERLGVAILDKL
eukprot:TRINITY_DN18278_c0_g2_i1.p2 TRINITY_DN18278_c0_g2~~TRINITY_DN18278_c0_g2_i1.p2  ORF type:complete len:245 (+),score=22.37 TRINITY_DN18278_c0_g2_i1:25-759(+)